MNTPLVNSQWLFENLNHPDLVVLDASAKKVTENQDKTIENTQIKGARFFDLKNKFSDKIADLPNTFTSVTQFESEAQKLGINNNSLIVVYDNLGIYSAPRVWWMLQTMGHQNVAVLDGGLPEWVKHKFPTEEKTSQQYRLGNFKAVFNSEHVKDYNFIKANLNNINKLVIDARSKGRFDGKAPEPREGLRSGSIPNSSNIPFGDVLENGKYKSKEELTKIFSSLNTENKELIYSCGSGLTACILLLASEIVLPNKTSVYDGSWTEWAQIEK